VPSFENIKNQLRVGREEEKYEEMLVRGCVRVWNEIFFWFPSGKKGTK
jgi:hypothetical protein